MARSEYHAHHAFTKLQSSHLHLTIKIQLCYVDEYSLPVVRLWKTVEQAFGG